MRPGCSLELQLSRSGVRGPAAPAAAVPHRGYDCACLCATPTRRGRVSVTVLHPSCEYRQALQLEGAALCRAEAVRVVELRLPCKLRFWCVRSCSIVLVCDVRSGGMCAFVATAATAHWRLCAALIALWDVGLLFCWDFPSWLCHLTCRVSINP